MSAHVSESPKPTPNRRQFLQAGIGTLAMLGMGCQVERRKPNFIVIMTDDQGYGDLSATGNPILKTPHTDSLATNGMRFESFHVCPVCAPTRASLMTGRYNFRTGVVDTYKGRAMMHSDEVTVAELLKGAGYRTGIFGKWHLGDNVPLRPQDQGFDVSRIHMGGGIGQPGDYPGNMYMDPMLREDGEWRKFTGYCTDVFTDGLLDFIDANKDRPFFAYLPTNAPHTPLQVPDEWVEPFKGKGLDEDTERIYAMVQNIDDNIGRILAKLDELDLAENTVVMFLTDNGPQQPGRYNADMRGRKGTVYQGGIRVPLFVRWPAVVRPGSESRRLTAHMDIMPTLCDIARVPLPRDLELDGRSLLPLLEGRAGSWVDRTLFTQWHRGDAPIARESAAVLTERYKLVLKRDLENGMELFDLLEDPGETTDISERMPHLRLELARRYDRWLDHVSATRGYEPPRIHLGDAREDPTTLTRQDWRGPRAGWTEDDVLGYWEVDVRQTGTYQIKVRTKALDTDTTVHVRLGNARTDAALPAGETAVDLPELALPAGPGRLEAWVDLGGQTRGVWYVDVERMG
jgi:arylsulfatase A-like enzyme